MSNWIWLDKKMYPQYCDNKRTEIFGVSEKGFCMAEFEREYVLDSNAVLRICADARYELYVNGELKGRGPATPGADFLTKEMRLCYYDEYEITDTSSVKIRVVVTSTATALSQFTFGYPCLYVSLLSNGKEIGGTDKSWRSRRLTERKGIYFTDYTECADEWSEPEILDFSRNMEKSRIDHVCEEPVYPTNFDKISVEPHKSVEVCLNFDKIYSAYPHLCINNYNSREADLRKLKQKMAYDLEQNPIRIRYFSKGGDELQCLYNEKNGIEEIFKNGGHEYTAPSMKFRNNGKDNIRIK